MNPRDSQLDPTMGAAVGRVMETIRRHYPEGYTDWVRVRTLFADGQLCFDGDGNLRFRGDRFTRERFDSAR
jgi:hypothetical protein